MSNLKQIKKLVSIKSYDTTQNEEIIEYLKNEFKNYSQEIVEIKNTKNNRSNLLIGINTKLRDVKDAIILSGHIDTVPANETEYNTNPYFATQIDDKLYGLGIIDMKSFFATILDNIKQIMSLQNKVIVAITSDEETNLEGVELITQELISRNIIPKLTIVGEPTDSEICASNKSCYEYKITIEGKSCHSSMPQNGINANYIASRLMLFIEKLCTKIESTTLSANIMSGGEKVNIISGSANISFDIRSNSNENATLAINKIKRYIKSLLKKYKGCKIELTNVLSLLPLEFKNKQLIQDLCNKFDLKQKEFSGGCEAGYFQKLGGDAFIFGVGSLSLAHKPNEFLVVNDYEKYSQKLLQILKYISNK